MTKFKEYITEATSFDIIKDKLHGKDDMYKELTKEFIDKVKRDCKPWLKSSKNKVVYRGIIISLIDIPVLLYDKKVRKDRVPLSITKEKHLLYNNLLYDKFGWKPRTEGLFVTGSKDMSCTYGTTYIVFPIGNFKYIWSPIVIDLYAYKQALNPNELVSLYTDKNLVKAIRSGHEIMIKCEKYHAIKEDIYND